MLHTGTAAAGPQSVLRAFGAEVVEVGSPGQGLEQGCGREKDDRGRPRLGVR